MNFRSANCRAFTLYALIMPLLLQVLLACGGGSTPRPEGDAAVAPLISSQPADTQAAEGSSAQFSVTAVGDDLSYQWEKSADNGATWRVIDGASTAATTLPAVAESDNGLRLRVRVSRGGLSTVSAVAVLQVQSTAQAPSITVEPAALQLIEGASASFSATAAGTGLSYQWQTAAPSQDWQDLPAATGPMLQLPAVTLAANETQYRLKVSNAAGSVTSAAATLSVSAASAAPAFISQPTAVSLVAGGAANFSARAVGQPTPSYQWQRSGDGGVSFQDIAVAATAPDYTSPATALADSGALYRVIASNSAGSVVSLAAALTVTVDLTAPVILQQPADQSVTSGATVVVNVVASGTPAPSYQWQISTDSGATFATINGATSPSYAALADVAAPYEAWLRVMVGNSQGQLQSRSARVTVVESPSLTVNAGGPYFPTVGTALTLNSIAYGPGRASKRLSYAWSILTAPGGSAAALQNAATQKPTLVPDVAGDYRVRLVVTNTAGVTGEATTVFRADTVPSCGASGPVGTLEMARQHACIGCHSVAVTGNSPSFMSIAAKYRAVCGAKAVLSSAIRHGFGSGQQVQGLMPENIRLTDTEVEQLANWILVQ